MHQIFFWSRELRKANDDKAESGRTDGSDCNPNRCYRPVCCLWSFRPRDNSWGHRYKAQVRINYMTSTKCLQIKRFGARRTIIVDQKVALGYLKERECVNTILNGNVPFNSFWTVTLWCFAWTILPISLFTCFGHETAKLVACYIRLLVLYLKRRH